MRPLITPEGDAALAALLAHRPLLAFDFDGTLAPIVEHPDDARIPGELVALLARLAARHPVAVVSGRAVADLRARLGFSPRYVIGNHGTEEEGQTARSSSLRWAGALDALRTRLRARAAELANAGVRVEDKGASIALHYRGAPRAAAALALIDRLLAPERAGVGGVRVFGGKKVVNAMAAAAPDKACAVRALVARAGAGAAFFAGDDANDEPVFAAAPPHWLTVRIGACTSSTAGWHVDGPQAMRTVVERLLAHG